VEQNQGLAAWWKAASFMAGRVRNSGQFFRGFS